MNELEIDRSESYLTFACIMRTATLRSHPSLWHSSHSLLTNSEVVALTAFLIVHFTPITMVFQKTLEKLSAAMHAVGLKGFDPSVGPILVTGANGVVSYRVAARLLAAKFPSVRVGAPQLDPVQKLADAGAEAVIFDWNNVETYDKALEGVKSVFISLPHLDNWEQNFQTFMDKAKAAGVQNFVKLSFYHALASASDGMASFGHMHRTDDPFLMVPLVNMHRECDIKLLKMPPLYDYTILFASHFMSNATVYQGDKIRKQHKFEGASGGKAVCYVSPNDVAEAATEALLHPSQHRRKGYNLTGPNPITDAQLAEMLSKRMKDRIIYEDKPIKEFAVGAEDTDWGPSTDVTLLEYAKASGYEQLGMVSHDFERICGHPSETYEEYLSHQDYMTPREVTFLLH